MLENHLLYEAAEILVTDGGTTPDVMEKIAERSESQRFFLDILDAGCPACGDAIKPSGDGFRCETCQKPAAFSLIKLKSKEIEVNLSGIDRRIFLENQSVEAETHIIFCHVGAAFKVIIRLEMKCLSCQEPMRKRSLILELLSGSYAREIVYCSRNCGVRTYLRTGIDDGRIYIEPHIQRVAEPFDDPFEIAVVDKLPDGSPIALPSAESESVPEGASATETLERDRETLERDSTRQPNPPNLHVNYKQQILELLRQENRPMKRREFFKALTGYTPAEKKNNNIDNALKNLVEDRLIAKVGHGKYVIFR